MNKTQDIDAASLRIQEKEAPGMWQDYPFGKPMSVCEFRDDFLNFDTGHWVVTEINAGDTQLLADARNGILVLTAGGTENFGTQIQLGNATTGESFAPASGKHIWFETYIATSDADQNDVFVGLHNQDTTVLGGLGTDYIGFQIVDASASINFLSAAASVVTTESAIATAVDATYVKLGFKVTGTSKIEAYVNDVLKATVTTTIPTALMQLTLGHLDGAAAGNTLSLDYVCIAQDR